MWIKELEQTAPALVPRKSTNTTIAGDGAAEKSIEQSAIRTLEESHGQCSIVADTEAKACCCANALEEVSSSEAIPVMKKATVSS